MNVIVVNATALDSSGGLSILRQFLNSIPKGNSFEYVVFISPVVDIDCANPNVRLVRVVGVKSFVKRFMWDAFGVARWLKHNKVVASASLSLQNTNFRTGFKIPNYLYYHQSIPFFPFKWSVFNSQQRTLWFYKNVYPFFVQIFINKRTEVFTQLEFIKEGFIKRFNFDRAKIQVVSPTISQPNISTVDKINLPQDKICLFYPATPYFYKNHKVLFDALSKEKNINFVLYTTLEPGELECHNDNVQFMGRLSFEEVLSFYASCDALVFPSYIETYGLPLIEAASFGLPIVSADLAYAWEVLSGYDGVSFVEYNNVSAWQEALEKLSKNKRFDHFAPKERASWKKLFEIIENNIHKTNNV